MRKCLIGGLSAAAMLVASAPPAQAAPVCREARVLGVYVVTACVDRATWIAADGTTVSPHVGVTCYVDTAVTADPCNNNQPPAVNVGKTGFVASASPPPVILDPLSGSVGIGGGTLGTLWVRGTAHPVVLGETCVGDPSVCS